MRTQEFISGVRPQVRGSLMLNNRTVPLSNSDFVSGSMSFKSGTSESNEFTVGAAIISGLDFALMNDRGKFSNLDWFGGQVQIFLDIPATADTDTVSINMGSYYIVKHNEQGNRITVECLDALKLLDEYQIYEDNITWPADAAAVVRTIATNRGLSVTGLVEGITIPDPGDDLMTERRCISYIAQMMGKFVTVHGSVMRFGWYNKNATPIDCGTTFNHDLRTDSISITGCKVSDYESTTTETRGVAGYMLAIADNPFITADNVSAVADLIGNAVTGITFRPGEINIVSSPSIEAGDIIKVATAKESNVILLATSVTYKPFSLRQRIISESEPYAGDLRIKRKAYVKKQTQDTIKEELSNPTSPLAQAIGTGGGGGGDSMAIFMPSSSWSVPYLSSNPCYAYMAGQTYKRDRFSRVYAKSQTIIVPSYEKMTKIAIEEHARRVQAGTIQETDNIDTILAELFMYIPVSCTCSFASTSDFASGIVWFRMAWDSELTNNLNDGKPVLKFLGGRAYMNMYPGGGDSWTQSGITGVASDCMVTGSIRGFAPILYCTDKERNKRWSWELPKA